jgi:RNA polymerase sigma-70 factor (ECF subfamily)
MPGPAGAHGPTKETPEPATDEGVARAGELEARFQALFGRFHRQVTAYALRRFETRTIAEDVVAETFLVAWRRIEDVPEGDGALPWLLGVARRVGANARRSDARRDRLVQALRHRRPASVHEVDEELTLTDTEELVRSALKRIKPTHAEVLRLVAWEELTRPQIAVVLGCSANAVGIRLHRARRALATELRKSSVESEHLLFTRSKPEVLP